MLDFHCVGETGFEPATPCSQSRCANRTALHPVCSLLPLLPPSLQVGGAVCVPKQPKPSAASCRCRLLPTAGSSLPTAARRRWLLAAARAGRGTSGSPGCKDNGFFGAHQLFASKSFSGPEGHHRGGTARRRGAPSPEGVAAEGTSARRTAARKPAELPCSRCRGGIVARRTAAEGPAARKPRRTAALLLPRRGITAGETARSQVLQPGGATHFCRRPSPPAVPPAVPPPVATASPSPQPACRRLLCRLLCRRPSQLPARRRSRFVAAARPSPRPAIAAARRTGG